MFARSREPAAQGIGVMLLGGSLIQGRLIKRYKRFLADIELDSGKLVTAHCANTGKMTGCAEPGSRVWLSQNNNPARKLKYSWELARSPAGHFIGIHSAKANDIVAEALLAKRIDSLAQYSSIQREVKLGDKSRIDFLLSSTQEQCYVEVKSVTLLTGAHSNDGLGMFPDTVSDRATRHVHELVKVKQQGHRAVLLFCVQHSGIKKVCPADEIDMVYGEAIREAIAQGVEVLVYGCELSTVEITLGEQLPWYPSLAVAKASR